MDDEGGRWIEEPLLPELPAPAADQIIVRGAQLVRVVFGDVAADSRHQGYTEAVVLAWAKTAQGGWGVLLAWGGSWRQRNGRSTVKARWAWCRLLPDRVTPVPRPRALLPEDEWHRHHPGSEFSEAVRAAAASLPEHLRDRALQPAEPPPDRPPSVPGKP
jgi:hypothetical protein